MSQQKVFMSKLTDVSRSCAQILKLIKEENIDEYKVRPDALH